MIELLKILIPYCCGVICTFILFHPQREWMDGYYTARKTYGCWDKGFDSAWKEASELFKNYDSGFGDGFEAGWKACEEQRGEQ
jgi:hypothetical protein